MSTANTGTTGNAKKWEEVKFLGFLIIGFFAGYPVMWLIVHGAEQFLTAIGFYGVPLIAMVPIVIAILAIPYVASHRSTVKGFCVGAGLTATLLIFFQFVTGYYI